jgi:hypothetical protein
MRPNPLRDMCTCIDFEAHVTQVMCFKIHAGVYFNIHVVACVTQMTGSHTPYIGADLIKFA